MTTKSEAIKQLPLFVDVNVSSAEDYVEAPINLREELKSDIPSTTYLTHAIHNVYPAKFIPQVPRLVIQTFKLEGKVILDPFAGSGTTAVESLITGNSNISNDINPLTGFLVDVKTMRINPKEYLVYTDRVNNLVDSIFKSKQIFAPRWESVRYWYPEEILQVLMKMWGGIHNISESEDHVKKLLKAAALHISRKYSYGEDKSPKLFKSKHKTIRMKELLGKFNYFGEQLLQNELLQRTKAYLDCVMALNSKYQLSYTKTTSFGSKDDLFLLTLTKSLEELCEALPEGSVDCVITSPPYIYAQEYFRSTKIDLYWLDMIDEKTVRTLAKKEIGQKAQSFFPTDILSDIKAYINDLQIVQELSAHFKTKENVSRFSAYFGDMWYFIQLSSNLLSRKGIFAILVGEPKVFGHPVRVKDILIEMMAQNNLDVKYALFDTIKGRHLSKNRLNVNPSGISGEWLIIGEKP